MMLLARSQSGDRERARALLTDARRTAEALRMDVLARWIEQLGGFAEISAPGGRADETVERESTLVTAVFRKEGDCWAVGFGEQLARVRPAAGFRHIAVLLGSPGVAFQAGELIEAAARAHDQADPPATGLAEETARSGRISRWLGDAGESLDRRAAAEYRRRLADLKQEFEEARRCNDEERACRHAAEIEFLGAQLVRDLGLGGRPRRAGSHAERARINVTRAIDRALKVLGERVPPLGRYLETTIKTGTFCSYTPDPRFLIAWQL
jgi:hypothetical protein